MLPPRRRAAAPLMLVALAVGCGDAEGERSEQPSEPTSAGETSTGPGWGEEITVGVALTMSVQEPELGESGRLDVRVAATNSGLSEGSIELFLQCAGNYKTGSIVTDADTPAPALTSGSVPSDSSVEGFVSLTLPTHEGEVVESCKEDTISLVVPGFAGQDATYPIPPDLAEDLLSGSGEAGM